MATDTDRSPGPVPKGAERKPGPVPKGPRKQFTLRIPDEHWAVYEDAAADAGQSMVDYLVDSLARDHKLKQPNRAQEPHDIAKAEVSSPDSEEIWPRAG